MDAALLPNLKPLELCGVARAWCDVNEERRKLKMQPLPRSVDVSKLPVRGRGRRASAVPSGPVEPGAPAKVEPKSAPECPACPVEPSKNS